MARPHSLQVQSGKEGTRVLLAHLRRRDWLRVLAFAFRLDSCVMKLLFDCSGFSATIRLASDPIPYQYSSATSGSDFWKSGDSELSLRRLLYHNFVIFDPPTLLISELFHTHAFPSRVFRDQYFSRYTSWQNVAKKQHPICFPPLPNASAVCYNVSREGP